LIFTNLIILTAEFKFLAKVVVDSERNGLGGI
jgi:hypothetical protein